MKVTLRKGRTVVGSLTIHEDGSLGIELGGAFAHLPAKPSRRIAGEVLKASVESTAETVRQGVRARARAELDKLFDWDDDTDDVP